MDLMLHTLPHATPVHTPRHTRPARRGRFIATAALGAALLVTGSAIAAQAETESATHATAASAATAPELSIPDAVVNEAKSTIAEANAVLDTAVEGVDTGELRDYVHKLSNYDTMPQVKVVGLVDAAAQEAQEVVAQTAQVKADAARQAAEEKRAAEEKAAAEQAAAAERAAAEAAAAQAVANASTPQGAQAAARDIAAADYGWGADQFGCLSSLWMKESGWNYQAMNPSSGAYGIPQSLPGSKMATVGADWQTNPVTQIRWGLDYISRAYGTPCAAWGHSQATNWY
ncbi:phospholipase [Microbacterium sp. Marseille-Q6965]|uniref:aggregation-promoting factor C-terminal-like domain-containing protein n=1 Tax=Microbacterium sp. Marseille-Q6965 TaxID=2965072 RepID=UPI0021B83F87|nr:phospholipase [Microbacterium sp. Marseille-Q6965]